MVSDIQNTARGLGELDEELDQNPLPFAFAVFEVVEHIENISYPARFLLDL